MRRILLATVAAASLVASLAGPASAAAKSPFLEDDYFSAKTTIEQVKATIAAGGDVKVEDEYGRHALHKAIDGGAPIEVIRFLIDQGAPVNQPDPARTKPAHTAAYSPNALEVLKLLKEKGADLTAKDYMEATFALGLIWGDKFDPALIAFAKEAGVDITQPNRCGNTLLTESAWAEHDAAKWFDAMTAEGLNPTVVDCEGNDMFMKSIAWGDGSMAPKLFEMSEDPFAANNAGLSGVLLAAQWGVNKARLDFLKDKGFDLKAVSRKGENAIIINTIWGDAESLTLLLAEGLDVNSESKDGTTPLLNALSKGRWFKPDVVKAAVEAGADINHANAKGETALLRLLAVDPSKADAGAEKAAELIDWMIAKGADPKAVDAGGATALIYAVKGRQPVALLKRLIDAGIDVNATDGEGTTALMHAAETATDPAVLELLIEAGADVGVKDVFDDTVAVIAADNRALAGSAVLNRLQ